MSKVNPIHLNELSQQLLTALRQAFIAGGWRNHGTWGGDAWEDRYPDAVFEDQCFPVLAAFYELMETGHLQRDGHRQFSLYRGDMKALVEAHNLVERWQTEQQVSPEQVWLALSMMGLRDHVKITGVTWKGGDHA